MKKFDKKKFAILLAESIALGLLAEHRREVIRSVEPTADETDYSDPSNWYKIPEITKDVDTFFIYPTVYVNFAEDAPAYAPIGDPEMNAGVDMMYKMQACVYEESTNLFMPYYRQANLKTAASVTANEFTGLLKDHYPQQDIEAALDYYFEHYNNGRPFIIAGHSQGSAMTRLMLKEYFAKHPEYYKRMIAAYVIGYSVTKDDLAEYPHLRFAEAADDTGVIVSWNVEGPGNKNHSNCVVLDGAISINPLNWKRDDTYAPADENLGSYVQDEGVVMTNVESVSEEQGMKFKIADIHADAQVDTERGTVVCTTKEYPFIEVGEGVPSLFGPESFHNMDYGMYFKNIQENVQTRINAWKAK